MLQHVYLDEVSLIFELNRVGSKNCIYIHYIDLNDCFSGGKNSLRFSDKVWHSQTFKSPIYTNRICAKIGSNYFHRMAIK